MPDFQPPAVRGAGLLGFRRRVSPPRTARAGRALEAALGLALIVMIILTLGINLLRRGGAAEDSGDPSAGLGDGGAAPPALGVLHEELFAVADAVELPDGGWAALDRGARHIHVIGPEGEPERRFGGAGGGPGQLPMVVAVAALGDTIVVVGGVDGSVHYFHRSGRFLRKERHPHPRCPGNMVVGAEAAGGGVMVLYRCLSLGSPGLEASVRIIRGGEAREVVRIPLGDEDAGRVLNPMAFPVLAASNEAFLLGSHLAPCLEGYDLDGRPAGRTVCAPERPRVPMPRSLGAEALRKRAAERAGVRVEIPRHLPPFDRVFLTSEGPVFRAVTSERGRALDLVRGDGAPETLLEEATDATFVGESSVLLASTELDGTRIRIVRLEPRG